MPTHNTCAHTPTCIHVPTPTHTYTYVPHTDIRTHTHVHTCAHTHTPTRTPPHPHTYTHTDQVLSSPREQAVSPPSLRGLSSHATCLRSRGRTHQGPGFAQRRPGRRGDAAGGHGARALTAPVFLRRHQRITERPTSSTTQACAKRLPGKPVSLLDIQTSDLSPQRTRTGPPDLTAEPVATCMGIRGAGPASLGTPVLETPGAHPWQLLSTRG